MFAISFVVNNCGQFYAKLYGVKHVYLDLDFCFRKTFAVGIN